MAKKGWFQVPRPELQTKIKSKDIPMSADIKLRTFIDKEIQKTYKEKVQNVDKSSKALPALFPNQTNYGKVGTGDNLTILNEKSTAPLDTKETKSFKPESRKVSLEKITQIALEKKLSDKLFKSVLKDLQDSTVENFFESIKMNDTDVVREMLQQNPMIMVELDDQMRNCLHLACLYGQTEVLELLLD